MKIIYAFFFLFPYKHHKGDTNGFPFYRSDNFPSLKEPVQAGRL